MSLLNDQHINILDINTRTLHVVRTLNVILMQIIWSQISRYLKQNY